MIYLLFSDGIWDSVKSEEKIQKVIENHYWRFPLDIKGDSRRAVTILRDVNNTQFIKGV